MANDLCFREDGTFTIVQFTDLHIGGDSDKEEDLRTLSLVRDVLAEEKPDLIVYTGDLISSYGAPDPTASFRRAIAPAAESGIPWTHVFGNHDAEENVTREELMAIALAHDACYSQEGPADLSGVGNYMLTIQSMQSGNPAAVLYFIDSGAMAPELVAVTRGLPRIRWIGIDGSRLLSANRAGLYCLVSLFFIFRFLNTTMYGNWGK